jgi:hypothetical protein
MVNMCLTAIAKHRKRIQNRVLGALSKAVPPSALGIPALRGAALRKVFDEFL